MIKNEAREQQHEPGPVRITVANGDLSFVAEPLFLGHYRSSRLTGTEGVMDARIGGAMSRALRLDLYPTAAETNHVFLNCRTSADEEYLDPRPHAVVVVGLGDEGALTETVLSRTVRQGVLVWAERAAEIGRGSAGEPLTIAATLIGSGGLGVGVGQSARAIAQGVLDANRKLEREGCPGVGHLWLIELYLDRATEAWRALRLLDANDFDVDRTVGSGRGSLKRTLDAKYRGAEYDLLSVVAEPQNDGRPLISYSLSTKRARTEVTAKRVQHALVGEMIEHGSNHNAVDANLVKALFNLLVPVEIEPFLAGTTELQLELEAGTAGIPWELLDTPRDSADETPPWAIRSKLVRKLRAKEFRRQVSDPGRDSAALIIGEPLMDQATYWPLPAARAEATAIAGLLANHASRSLQVVPLVGPPDKSNAGADAERIIKALLSRPWKVVHICGHGEKPSCPASVGAGGPRTSGVSRGVVLSHGKYLGPDEIHSLRSTPELVFLNCCYLAQGPAEELLGGAAPEQVVYDRSQFAAGIADALIGIGVRCVVAAGWAVDDAVAREFAEEFYAQLLDGARFADAVAAARLRAWKSSGNTWAAFQCYGDPDWHLRGDSTEPADSPSPDIEFDGVASGSGLRLALHTLAVRSKYQGAASKQQAAALLNLERHFITEQPRLGWASIGSIAESFAVAWAEVGDLKRAIGWYRRAAAAPDGSASIRAAEQLANLRVRQAWESVAADLDRCERSPANTAAGSTPTPAERRLVDTAQAARQEVSAAIAELEKLLVIRETSELQSLLGSGYKRRAMIEEAMGSRPDADAWIVKMLSHYTCAEALAAQEPGQASWYPAANCLGAEVAQNAGVPGWQGLSPSRLGVVKASLREQNRRSANFWSKVGEAELLMYEALAAGNLSGERERLIRLYRDLGGRVTATRYWRSVYDQARFVLQRYRSRASEAEQSAAAAVLEVLRRLARGVRGRPA